MEWLLHGSQANNASVRHIIAIRIECWCSVCRSMLPIRSLKPSSSRALWMPSALNSSSPASPKLVSAGTPSKTIGFHTLGTYSEFHLNSLIPRAATRAWKAASQRVSLHNACMLRPSRVACCPLWVPQGSGTHTSISLGNYSPSSCIHMHESNRCTGRWNAHQLRHQLQTAFREHARAYVQGST